MGERLKTCKSRKSKDGQKGIISAIAFSSDLSGLYAAGSYSGNISFYTDGEGETRMAEMDMGEKSAGVTQVSLTCSSYSFSSSSVFCCRFALQYPPENLDSFLSFCLFRYTESMSIAYFAPAHQLVFHPTNPCILFCASRMSNHIAVYDMRNLTGGPVARLKRPGWTQQKIIFDVDWTGRYLVTGGTDGRLRIYDVNCGIVKEEPVYDEKLEEDVISMAGWHPYKPWVLTATGSRRTRPPRQRILMDSDEEKDSSDDDFSSSSEDSYNSSDTESDSDSDLEMDDNAAPDNRDDSSVAGRAPDPKDAPEAEDSEGVVEEVLLVRMEGNPNLNVDLHEHVDVLAQEQAEILDQAGARDIPIPEQDYRLGGISIWSFEVPEALTA